MFCRFSLSSLAWYNKDDAWWLPAAKRLQMNEPVNGTTLKLNLDATYTYNDEGGVASVAYPNSGPIYNYSYDGCPGSAA